MSSRLYAVWGCAILIVLATAQYRGWTLSSSQQGKTNPTSVRANPGAYRSPYYVPGRTLRGK
jgi:hypothetical protein